LNNFQRPVVEVYHVENQKTVNIGKVVAPFKCCSLELNIFDSNNDHKFDVHGDCK